MTKFEKEYTFSGFGFDVLLSNVEIKSIHGEEYPDINLNEVKLHTAKQLLISRERLTGIKLKFLRTFLKLSFQKLADIINAPASTIRAWEEKNNEASGMNIPQERQFRFYAIEYLIGLEKKHLEKQIIMAESFEMPKNEMPLDLSEGQDYSYLIEV